MNNGFTGGEIEDVITQVANTARSAGKTVQIVDNDIALIQVCRSSLRGASDCFVGASFYGSPSEGTGAWNYTIRADGAFGEKIFVDRKDNDAEVYILPFQHAIDSAIASSNGSSLPDNVQSYPFTSQNDEERSRYIQELFMDSLISILAVAFFVGVCGVTYQLTGHMASEREIGMSQLIEAMVPNNKVWKTQAARLLSLHLAFDIMYFPGWVIMGFILAAICFPSSSKAIVVIYHIIIGLSLSSFSVLGGSLFRKAQLSGITVTLTSVILAIVAQVTSLQSAGAVAILSLLFPPMNYVYFIIFMARWERQHLASNLVKGAPNSPWQIPGIVFWILAVVQIFAFPIIGAFVERRLYGTASKARNLRADPELPAAIKITGFSKHYLPNWWQSKVTPRFGLSAKETVIAVNDLSLSASRGEILALLGANGSGKSTTLNAICGLHTISEGSIDVDGTGGLGYCPQKNVMWDELTVFEHVRIFNKLKATGAVDSKAAIERLIVACDLKHKVTAKSKTLSGGQKRKLQLAMMFTGGSRVCCIDEVSSGIDPLSRRKIWDILLAERGARTMLLTTHFLDEADILADRIAILSKGSLKAEGSAAELKNRFGGGYRVYLRHGTKVNVPIELDAARKSLLDREMFQLSNSSTAARFVADLQKNGTTDYQVTGPSIEDVFLKLAEEVQGSQLASQTALSQHSEATPKAVADDVDLSQSSAQGQEEEQPVKITTGNGTGMAPQAFILFKKRCTVVKRNFLPYVVAVLLPIIAAGLVTMFLDGFKGLSCDPGAGSNNPRRISIGSGNDLDYNITIPCGPQDRIPIEALTTFTGLNSTEFSVVSSIQQFNTFVRDNYATVKPGGFFLGDTPTFAYQGDTFISYSVITQNLFNNLLTGTPISTSYQTFAVPFAPGAGKTLQLILYFGLAMSAYPAFFTLYPTIERLRKVRALHYSNGIRAAPLWLAYLTFDFLFVLLISAIVTIIFATASNVWYYPAYLFVIFFLYGLTSVLLSYVVSLFASSQLAAFAFAAGGQCVFFLLFFIMCLSIITYADPLNVDSYFNITNYVYNLVTPSGNLLRALLLTLNEFSLLCRGNEKVSYPGGFRVYGSPITYLIFQAIILLTFLVWWDSGSKIGFIRRKAAVTDSEHNEASEPTDPAVLAENERVDSTEDPLKVSHVSKIFGSNHAVDNVSFGTRHSEVFALLGPNGAGKSTTISLIRGDLRPSRRGGDVFVEGTSITKHRAKARMNLGVCPQFDAMDTMTVREHLLFYARARGVPKQDIPQNIETVLKAVNLHQYASRMASKLSGGNQRKLSLGIALMGNPSVLLLDEPSSGMDAAAKRIMWKTLSAVTHGRALLITTHSMEEADALAHRVGIMARKMLAVGTTEELRERWGNGWYIHLVLRDPAHATDDQMEKVASWIQNDIPEASIEGKMMHGQIRVHVDSNDVSVAKLFETLERGNEDNGIEYYSVGRATLDQVFLEIVGRHNILEEGHEEEKRLGGEKKGRFRRFFRG